MSISRSVSSVLVQNILDPVDYFDGWRRSVELPPDNILCFVRRSRAELWPVSGPDSFHERWVLLVALSGKGVIRVDRNSVELRPGNALLVPPLHLHSYPEADRRLRWLFITFDWPGHTAHSGEWSGPRKLHSLAARHLRSFLAEVATTGSSGNVLAARLIDLVRSLFPARSIPTTETAAPVGTLLSSIKAAVARDVALRLPSLARELGVSESHLRARFRREVGISLGRYLRETRLRAAARSLREKGGTVKAAAAAAGYPDPFTFSRSFRRVLGISPVQVRLDSSAGRLPTKGSARRQEQPAARIH